MNINLRLVLAVAALVIAVLVGHEFGAHPLLADGFGWGDITPPPAPTGTA
ncbi:hypothetical protein R8Z50_03265 [Longispora sp. K20-0274]